MKLFNFFRRNKKGKENSENGLPDIYKNIVTAAEYQFALRIAKNYHEENGLNIVNVGAGELIVNVDGTEQHRYLDNLIRMLPSYQKEQWPKVIYEHFNKLKDHSSAYHYLYKDFEYAAQFLRVLIKGADLYKTELGHFVCRCDFPETNTFLVLEFEEQFRYVTKKDIVEWGVAEDELFSIGVANTPDEEIETKQYRYCEKFPVYIFFSGDYSSSLMLDLAARAEYAVGTYGSLIAIPTKGTAFVHPIESGDIMELVETLSPAVTKFYNEDPGSITTNFYWLYGENIEMFPIGRDDTGAYIRLPPALMEIFRG